MRTRHAPPAHTLSCVPGSPSANGGEVMRAPERSSTMAFVMMTGPQPVTAVFLATSERPELA